MNKSACYGSLESRNRNETLQALVLVAPHPSACAASITALSCGSTFHSRLCMLHNMIASPVPWSQNYGHDNWLLLAVPTRALTQDTWRVLAFRQLQFCCVFFVSFLQCSLLWNDVHWVPVVGPSDGMIEHDVHLYHLCQSRDDVFCDTFSPTWTKELWMKLSCSSGASSKMVA